MKNIKANFFVKTCTILSCLLFLFFVADAQPAPGNPPEVPIDGGISWLAAAGVAYGVRKLYVYNKKGQNEA